MFSPFISSLLKDTGHTRLQQQSIKYRKNPPSVRPKTLTRRRKRKKRKKDNYKIYCVTRKRNEKFELRNTSKQHDYKHAHSSTLKQALSSVQI